MLILIESIIPPLPLGIFITILFINYGTLKGFIISWIFTVTGCILSFYLFKSILKDFVDKYIRKYKSIDKFVSIMDNINFLDLVIIISIPFTPAFLINIAAGISKIEIRKFLPAIMIGKISLVLYWGFIGTNIIESFKNPILLIKVTIVIVIMIILTNFISKKYNLN